MRLWKMVNGEPYMINDPRLGILGLNPKKSKRGKRMARRYGKSHMAWVRSFQKRRRKRNWVSAGAVTAPMFNPRRHRRYRRNPGRVRRYATQARGFLGLPPVMPIVYGAAGYVATAGISGMVSGFLPTEWGTNADGSENKLTKYGVLIVSLIGTTWAAKATLGAGPAALAGVGGGIYVIQQVVHDFMPGVVPGMSAYTSVRAYRTIRGPVDLAAPAKLAAPNWGAVATTASAPGGAANVVPARFRRFA